MSHREIILFVTESGRSPVADFIADIKRPSERAKIVKILEAIEETPILPVTIFKKMKGRGELWEVRALQYRFLGFHPGSGNAGPVPLVLVHAFQKQSQKTPLSDILVALRRRDAYLSRIGDLL